MPKLEVVFVEHDKLLHQPLQPHYESLFASIGYQAIFHWAIDEKGARTLIKQHQPHIFISDLTFGVSYLGLELIRNIKTEYPDIFVIGTSRADYSPRKLFEKIPTFDLFIDKARLLDGLTDYREWITAQLQRQFSVNTEVEILDFDSLISDHFEPKHAREVRSIIGQVSFSGHRSDDRMRPNRIRLAPLAGGLSGSRVFRLTADNKSSGFPSVPAVLKISTREFAEQEIENFQRYVRWGLPYIMRVDILGQGFTKNFGGICYSFVLSDDKKIYPLADLISAGKWAQVRSVLDKIFSPSTRRWYSDQLTQREDNINQRYTSRYFRGAQSKGISEEKFRAAVREMFGAAVEAFSVKIDGRVFPTPIELLFGAPNGDYFSCICHGDLNSNNIIVADNDEVIFIDFQETGRGHVFEDFVAIEASVRLHSAIDAPWLTVLETEERVGMGEDPSSLLEAYKIIALVRNFALKNFPKERRQNYYYAVAAYHFRLLRAQNMNESQKRRCVCALLAALSALRAAPANAS